MEQDSERGSDIALQHSAFRIHKLVIKSQSCHANGHALRMQDPLSSSFSLKIDHWLLWTLLGWQHLSAHCLVLSKFGKQIWKADILVTETWNKSFYLDVTEMHQITSSNSKPCKRKEPLQSAKAYLSLLPKKKEHFGRMSSWLITMLKLTFPCGKHSMTVALTG